MRAVIYARYSSTNQRAASTEDQIEICRRYIDQQGWTLVRTYEDRAMSGASRFRPGYQELLAAIPLRRFDVVVVEALDRLGRKLADVADLHDQLSMLNHFTVPVAKVRLQRTRRYGGKPRRAREPAGPRLTPRPSRGDQDRSFL